MGKDLYSVLDIDPDTNKKEIRKAYVQLARQYHPDVSKEPDARERFEEINLAYKILSDEETRLYRICYATVASYTK
jgi:DnaJ-class molecular chaperone